LNYYTVYTIQSQYCNPPVITHLKTIVWLLTVASDGMRRNMSVVTQLLTALLLLCRTLSASHALAFV